MEDHDSIVAKRCSKCGEEKPATSFRKDKRYRDGLYSYCRECALRECTLWRERNPEQAKAIYLRRYARNRETIRAAVKARFERLSEEEKDRVRMRSREWYRQHREQVSDNSQARYRANPLPWRESKLANEYGMSLAEYDDLFDQQQGRCAICNQPETAKGRAGGLRSLTVDHCHDSGLIRGLLCSRCNAALGLLRDDPTILLSAIDYLLNPR